MNSLNTPNYRVLNLIQMIVEVCIGAGFLLGIIPFMYLFTSGWVLPLTLVSLIISLIAGNNTLIFTIANGVMALLSFIPIIGIIPRLIGAFISLINIMIIKNKLNL